MIKEKYIDSFLRGIFFCIGVVIYTLVGVLYIYFVSQWRNEDIVQTLCSKHQYDFCEVVKQNIVYKYKEQLNENNN